MLLINRLKKTALFHPAIAGVMVLLFLLAPSQSSIAQTEQSQQVAISSSAVFVSNQHDYKIIHAELLREYAQLGILEQTEDEQADWVFIQDHNSAEGGVWLAIQSHESVPGMVVSIHMLDTQGRPHSRDHPMWKAIYRITEKAFKTINHDAKLQRAVVPTERYGFAEFDYLINRLDVSLQSKHPSKIEQANYPKKGRVYTNFYDSAGSLSLKLSENPNYQQYPEICYIYINKRANLEPDAWRWLERVEEILTRDDNDLLFDLVRKEKPASTRYERFIFESTDSDTHRIILIYETPELTEWKLARLEEAGQ